MSTRSNLGIQRPDGRYDYIYHHSDGYPRYLGVMLVRHYNSEEAARAIVNLGDLSFLDERLEPTPGSGHHFDYNKREKGVTVAYGRDRGEKNVEFRTTETDSYHRILEQEHAYVWRTDKNCWWYVNLDVPLEDVVTHYINNGA